VNYRMKRRDNAGGNHQRTIYPSLLKSRKGYHV
jgi:hypothetical protein